MSAVMPASWLTPGGGTNEPNSVNGVPVLELHANVLSSVPARPQSSHDRSTAPVVGPTRNSVSAVAVPPGLVTVSGPVVAPDGTSASIVESVVTLNDVATPPNLTAVLPVKLIPAIEIFVPATACLGRKYRMAGAPVNGPALAAEPNGVATRIGPLRPPAGIVAVMVESELAVNAASIVLNWTENAGESPEPRTLTGSPGAPA